ncbi:MAG: MBL fold metallo-hydrolase [Mucispirillum sp.]|nr:MBL fold metallo-hydrolase [Mucispirillum sp.]
MEKIDRIVNNRFNVNSYIYQENNKCIIIDCNIHTYDYIIKNKLMPEYMFLTHEHFDHIEGVMQIKKEFPNILIVSSSLTANLIKDKKSNMSYYSDGIGFEEDGVDIYTENKSAFHFNKHIINTYSTPGHTECGIVIEIGHCLFTGDTVLDVKTPANLCNSSKQQLIASLDFIDNHFDNDTVFYQGHGEPFLKKDWNKDISIGTNKKIKNNI